MNNFCIFPGCIDEKTNKPFKSKFNFKGLKPIFCSYHKEDNMIDLFRKRCSICKDKIPSFNKKGEKKPLYCYDCKEIEMVDVRSRMCFKCKIKRPSFNIEGETTPLYCKDCKEDGMINIKCKKCIKCKKKCPIFNIKGKKNALYCNNCKDFDMINVDLEKCISYWCDNQITMKNSIKYNKCCMRCYSYIFPDEIVSKNYTIKELAVVDFVKENYKDYKWVYNQRVYDSMTKRIIDLYLELEDQIIIIKVDEDKNIDYENTPDNKKLIKMLLDAKNKPVVFIRSEKNLEVVQLYYD